MHRPLTLAAAAAAACTVPGWPDNSVVNQWRFQGAREKCFCSYSEFDGHDVATLDGDCPSWRSFVSTDNATANKITQVSAATSLGTKLSNITETRFGSIMDWAIDFGAGFNEDCNTTLTPNCQSVGSHVLSIPNGKYYQDCCTIDGTTPSLAASLEAGDEQVCKLLADMLQGGIENVIGLDEYDSCRRENQDPTNQEMCLAQCFHFRPDVNWVHLHTTSGVGAMRDGPVDSGLGLGYNETEKDDASSAFGRYNVCACEPVSWGSGDTTTSTRGHCSALKPHENGYVKEATRALCLNVAGAAGVDAGVCEKC
jgi:hypothetical protein